jgi:membrane protease YdiL (CAAX protease family)
MQNQGMDLDAPRLATVVHRYGFGAVVRRHSLAAFVVLAYVFSWSYWVAIALTGGHGSHFPGLLGPLLAAFTVTFINQGRAGARDLLSQMFRWRVRLRWYAAALAPAVAGSATVAVLAVADNRWPTLHDLSTMPGLPSAGFGALLAMVLVINGYGEEVGWRGFAWARLRERHSIAGAAALLGIVWAGWHLPVFWLDTGMRDLDRFVIPGWIIGLIAGAVVLGWLYERARSSLLIVAIFHTLLNLASATLATEGLPAAVTTTAVIFWAVVILRRERSRSRSVSA